MFGPIPAIAYTTNNANPDVNVPGVPNLTAWSSQSVGIMPVNFPQNIATADGMPPTLEGMSYA